jgi:hypothetical protein
MHSQSSYSIHNRIGLHIEVTRRREVSLRCSRAERKGLIDPITRAHIAMLPELMGIIDDEICHLSSD